MLWWAPHIDVHVCFSQLIKDWKPFIQYVISLCPNCKFLLQIAEKPVSDGDHLETLNPPAHNAMTRNMVHFNDSLHYVQCSLPKTIPRHKVASTTRFLDLAPTLHVSSFLKDHIFSKFVLPIDYVKEDPSSRAQLYRAKSSHDVIDGLDEFEIYVGFGKETLQALKGWR